MTTGHPPVGTDVSGYRIEHLLGRGGMGTVYRAHDVRLDRPVALKLLAPGASGSDGAPERLLRESHMAARLDHPNVIPIYEAGQQDGRLFIAMRYIAGGDLKALLRREGALPPPRAVAVAAQIADALDAAHRRGLVHRDVKPSNVLLDSDDGREHCYLADFGLTQATTDRGPADGQRHGHDRLRRAGADPRRAARRASRPVRAGVPVVRVPDRVRAVPGTVGRRGDLRPPRGAGRRARPSAPPTCPRRSMPSWPAAWPSARRSASRAARSSSRRRARRSASSPRRPRRAGASRCSGPSWRPRWPLHWRPWSCSGATRRGARSHGLPDARRRAHERGHRPHAGRRPSGQSRGHAGRNLDGRLHRGRALALRARRRPAPAHHLQRRAARPRRPQRQGLRRRRRGRS